MMTTLKFYNPSFTLLRVKKATDSITKRKFSVTSPRYVMETGPLLLAKSSTISSPLIMAMVFIGYGISVGGYLLTRLSVSATEAQHIEMFPEDLEDHFFFVPDRVMRVMFRYLGAMRQAVNFWDNLEHLVCLTQAEARQMLDQLVILQELLGNVCLQCTYISDLNNPGINGDIEHIIHDLYELNEILQGIDSIINILTTII